jgi:uncharacterized membrane protein
MINIGIAGLLIGHAFNHNAGDRFGAANYNQFVPRKFFAELERDRRRELASTLRNSRPDFEKVHAQTGAQAGQLAAALADANYDSAKMNAMIDSFTTGSDSIAAKGAAALKDFYAKLTPDERTLLAKEIVDKQIRDNKAKP